MLIFSLNKNRINTGFLLCFILLSGCSDQFDEIISRINPDQNQNAVSTQASEIITTGSIQPTPTSTRRPTRTPRPPEPTLTPSPTATMTPAPTAEPYLFDDFNALSGWASRQEVGYEFGYANGGYYIAVDTPFTPIWSTRHENVSDIILRVDIVQVIGNPNGYSGLICRQQNDGYNYYIFGINPYGNYGIGKVTNGTLTFIRQGVDDKEIILQGNDVSNSMEAICIGNQLILNVNGQTLINVQDESFKSGYIGLVAGIQEKGKGLKVLFDNFYAALPQD